MGRARGAQRRRAARPAADASRPSEPCRMQGPSPLPPSPPPPGKTPRCEIHRKQKSMPEAWLRTCAHRPSHPARPRPDRTCTCPTRPAGSRCTGCWAACPCRTAPSIVRMSARSSCRWSSSSRCEVGRCVHVAAGRAPNPNAQGPSTCTRRVIPRHERLAAHAQPPDPSPPHLQSPRMRCSRQLTPSVGAVFVQPDGEGLGGGGEYWHRPQVAAQ